MKKPKWSLNILKDTHLTNNYGMQIKKSDTISLIKLEKNVNSIIASVDEDMEQRELSYSVIN